MKEWSHLGRERQLQSGEILWLQEDRAGHGALLLEGVLGVEKVSSEGDRVVFTELQPGALLGEMSCLDGQPHSATVKALARSKVRVFTASEMNDHLDRHPEQLKQLLLKQNQRLRGLTEKLLRVGTQSVHKRLAYWLCERGSERIAITHHELAAQLATTRESVSKALGQFRRQKLVRSGRGLVEVLDPMGLAALVEGP
jgi:CRP-like cAMP-binding protein